MAEGVVGAATGRFKAASSPANLIRAITTASSPCRKISRACSSVNDDPITSSRSTVVQIVLMHVYTQIHYHKVLDYCISVKCYYNYSSEVLAA